MKLSSNNRCIRYILLSHEALGAFETHLIDADSQPLAVKVPKISEILIRLLKYFLFMLKFDYFVKLLNVVTSKYTRIRVK